MVGGSSKNVSALLSCWKQKEMSASSGDVLEIVSFSMFSGYLPSLYLKHKERCVTQLHTEARLVIQRLTHAAMLDLFPCHT